MFFLPLILGLGGGDIDVLLWLSTQKSWILAHWPDISFCTSLFPLQKRSIYLCPRLRVALVYGYKFKYLEGRLATFSFNKTIVMSSPFEPITAWTVRFRFNLQHQMYIPAHEAVLRENDWLPLKQLCHYDCNSEHILPSRLVLQYAGSTAR